MNPPMMRRARGHGCRSRRYAGFEQKTLRRGLFSLRIACVFVENARPAAFGERQMLLAFGDHVLDSERRELRCGAELVTVEPQVFDLLVYLVQHHDRVVSKDDLLQAVWGGRIVSDAALAARINAARRALGDNGKAQRWIRCRAKESASSAPCARSRRPRRH